MIWEVSNWLAPTSFCKQKSMEIEWFLQLKTTHFTAEIDTLESWFLLGKNPTRTGSIDGLDHGLTWCTRGKGHVILPLLKISGKTNLNLSHQPKRDPRCREISCSLTSDCTSVQRRPPTSVHLRPFTQYFTFSDHYILLLHRTVALEQREILRHLRSRRFCSFSGRCPVVTTSGKFIYPLCLSMVAIGYKGRSK